MNGKTRQRRQAGFSLIELMVVITIIGILGGIVGVNVFTAMRDANRTATMDQMRSIESAVKMYRLQKRRMPDSIQDLVDAELLDTVELPQDAWGHEFYFEKLGSKDFQLISYGMDGVEGGEGEDEDIDREALRKANRVDEE